MQQRQFCGGKSLNVTLPKLRASALIVSRLDPDDLDLADTNDSDAMKASASRVAILCRVSPPSSSEGCFPTKHSAKASFTFSGEVGR